MEKKDVIFLATATICAAHTPKGIPSTKEEKDQDDAVYFRAWYQFLSERYEELQ